MSGNLCDWLLRHRRSSRAAFLLSIIARVLGSGMSLLWTRWLLAAMGSNLFGSFVSFQALASLGSMGDLGLGGAVGIETNRLLGAQKTDQLRHFLAAARTVSLCLALVAAGIFFVLSPWFEQWFGFSNISGSTVLLFLIGAVMIGAAVLANFTGGLSNACGNLTWPILPALLILQLATGLHLWIAKLGGPLWLQFVPYAGMSLFGLLLPWWMTRLSHPALATVRPLSFSWGFIRRILLQSFWVYLWSFGYLVYTATDRLVINRFFGPEMAARYYLNYKPCELAVFTLSSLTFFSLTKIIQWYYSPETGDRQRSVDGVIRLQNAQVLLGLTASLGYLVYNEAFIRIWLGSGYNVPFLLQTAFAANLAITICGDAGTKIAGQITARGTAFAGAMVATTAAINVCLSVVAAKLGSVVGIAVATLVAQAFFGLTTGYFTAGQLGLSKTAWLLKATALPIAVISAGYLLHSYFAGWPRYGTILLPLAYLAILLVVGATLGINRKFLAEEWQILLFMIRRKN